MAQDARAVANYFIERAAQEGKPFDQLKLYRLVYVAHGWHLATSGRPLITEPVEAYRYEAMVRSLRRAFRGYGLLPIVAPITDYDPEYDREVPYYLDFRPGAVPQGVSLEEYREHILAVLGVAWERFRDTDGDAMAMFTFGPGSPWEAVKERGRHGPSVRRVIPDEMIEKQSLDWAAGTREKASV